MGLYIGLMSGTSMDGVDAALIDLPSNQLIAGITRPYSPEAWARLSNVLNGQTLSLSTLSQLNTVLGREFALAVLELLEKASCSPKDIIAIGSHGQTICHDATADIPYTVQLGCAHTIAEMTGIRVVADFRTRDLVVGGQGAPFAPLYHQELFSHQKRPFAVVNIGGIANVTFLEASGALSGYDTGPGNCLMDAWARKHLNQSYDANGEWAASGQVISSLLSECLSDSFFEQIAPKSIGKEYFSEEWLSSKLKPSYSPSDIQATLLELTARTIFNELNQRGIQLSSVIICGGGVHNASLMKALQHHSESLSVVSSREFGVDPDFIEAMMFAWFAEKAIHNIPLNLNSLTGAKNTAVLGVIYPKKQDLEN